jgi:molybdopterin-biosynthesis enzyme MoeA-like protein
VLTRCEVVAIGTDLLPGQTVDTNPSWMGAQPGIGRSNLHA